MERINTRHFIFLDLTKEEYWALSEEGDLSSELTRSRRRTELTGDGVRIVLKGRHGVLANKIARSLNDSGFNVE
jgi:hypothetical protein